MHSGSMTPKSSGYSELVAAFVMLNSRLPRICFIITIWHMDACPSAFASFRLWPQNPSTAPSDNYSLGTDQKILQLCQLLILRIHSATSFSHDGHGRIPTNGGHLGGCASQRPSWKIRMEKRGTRAIARE